MSEPQLVPEKEEVNTARRLLKVATSAFARKGYYGTSIRDIARELKLSVATLYYYAQNKEDLYLKVFQMQYAEESRLVGDILDTADETTTHHPAALRELIYRLMDALIDRSVANPDVVRLWTQRWLEKPAQTENIETKYFIPLYEKVEELLSKAQAAGVIHPEISNVDLVSHSFTWLHYGYFGMGQLTFRPDTGNPFKPEQVEEFRAFIRTFVDRMLRFSDQS